MKKFCPNCGAELKPNAKFCQKCGKDVSKITSSNQTSLSTQNSKPASPETTRAQNRKSVDSSRKNQKIRNYCLIIGTLVVCAAAIVLVVTTIQNQRNSRPVVIKQEQKQKKAKKAATATVSSSGQASNQSSSSEDDNVDESRHYSRRTRTAKEWTNSQEDKLADFMSDFGDKMDQNYDEYDGDASDSLTNASGISYPDAFHDDDFLLNGSRINIGWDPALRKSYDYHVVAIFNYDGTKGANDDEDDDDAHITYLFAIHNGSPVALVEQTPSDDDNVEVKETANHDVREAFANIFENR